MSRNKQGMSKLVTALVIMAIILAVVAITTIAIYNSLVSASVTIDQSWSEVRNQYQRQADLIPNLINSTKGYMQYEQAVLMNITNARTSWLNSLVQSQQTQDQAGVQMNIATGAFLATVENYPELKADQVVLDLMDELAGTQNRITVARGRYIEAIGTYNIQVRSFPTNIGATLFGFTPKEFYTGSQGIETPPTVTFP